MNKMLVDNYFCSYANDNGVIRTGAPSPTSVNNLQIFALGGTSVYLLIIFYAYNLLCNAHMNLIHR